MNDDVRRMSLLDLVARSHDAARILTSGSAVEDRAEMEARIGLSQDAARVLADAPIVCDRPRLEDLVATARDAARVLRAEVEMMNCARLRALAGW